MHLEKNAPTLRISLPKSYLGGIFYSKAFLSFPEFGTWKEMDFAV